MALPSISDLHLWVGNLFTKDDWDFNFTKIVSWFSDGNADLVVNSIRSTNGIDLDGSQLTNVGTATSGSSAVNLDQAQTLLNRTSYYYPYSVASGKVDSEGNSAFLQKDSDTQVTVLAGNTNPDLVVIQSDGTVESLTSNYVLTVGTSDGTYNIVKEKEGSPVITTGAVTVGKVFPTSPNAGDYFLDNSIVPFVGYKYNAEGGWTNTPFCHLGYVTKTSGNAVISYFGYNNNLYNVNLVEFYTNGASGYRVYADGYKIQWGRCINMNITSRDVEFLIPFANSDYTASGAATFSQGAGDKRSSWYIRNLTPQSMTVGSQFETGGNSTIYWQAMGY